ncbi:Bacterial extracellular solute-binding protein [Caprobacter fermentans]|uniref:Bacterial extracellular solute-binding protein n=1 Tax=Caproicibacter fermentans TaxID=2576756 RepID=A0A6N8HVR8_9FIRM|nr:extracellular solute-binding protein [Caproicibacter fermentans]MVB09886.1 Bacterial extracellular solute-binding protein [Caproicibacter fermentans]
MKAKHLFAGILSLSVLLTTVTACAGSPNASSAQSTENSSQAGTASQSAPAEKITLTFWNNYTNDTQHTMENTIKQWNSDHPNIQIEASSTENNAYKTKIKTAIAADSAPDIIYTWAGGFTEPFVKAGKILPLDDYLNDGTKDKLLSGALTNITFDGKVYGLTYNQQAGALYVNNDLFEQNGVKVPTTFDELLTAVKTFKSKGITPMTVGEKDEWPGMWYYDMIALREGGAQLCLDALNKKESYDQTAFAEAAQKLQDLVDAGAFPKDVLGVTRDESVAMFTQGKIPMYFGGNFDAQVIDDSLKGKVSAVKFPTIAGAKGTDTEYLGGGADALCVSANSKHKDEAVQAIKYLASEFSSGMYLTGGGLPEWKYDSLDQSKIDPLSKEIMENIVKGSTGSVPAWDLYLTGDDAQTHLDLVQSLFGKQISPQDFAKQMQQKVNKS